LRGRLVCGLRSETVQRRLLSEKDLTLQKAYDLAHSLETASRRASELQATAKIAAAQVPKEVQRVAPRRPGGAVGSPPQCCYRCGKVGHLADKCHYRLQKCRACGKMGHIAKMCRSSGKGASYGTLRPNALSHDRNSQSVRKSGRTGYVGNNSAGESEESNQYNSFLVEFVAMHADQPTVCVNMMYYVLHRFTNTHPWADTFASRS